MIENLDVDSLLNSMIGELKQALSNRSISDPKIIGIRTGGVWIAERIKAGLGLQSEVGELDISFYRDDFTQIGLNPTVSPSSLPFATESQSLVLVDDVLMTGRTIRAAMNELFDYGRPANIILVTLLDLDNHELPIRADIVGKVLNLDADERIKLQGPENLALKIERKDS